MLEVRHLHLVCAIVDEGGPTRAAARLHLTQSAVSHQLAELENRLGIPLFARVRRRLELTAAGKRLLAGARAMLTDLSHLESDLARGGERRRDTLRLAVECFTSYHWLPAIARQLVTEHPQVDISIVLEASREPLAALLAGTLDLALVSSRVRDRMLQTVPLFRDEWCVAMASSHPLAAKSFVTAGDLTDQVLFTQEATRKDVALFRELLAAERARLPRTVKIPLTDALVGLVQAQLGIAIVSRWAVAPWESRGEIVTRRFTRGAIAETWCAVYRRDAESRLPLARFVELLRSASPSLQSPRAKKGKAKQPSTKKWRRSELPGRRQHLA